MRADLKNLLYHNVSKASKFKLDTESIHKFLDALIYLLFPEFGKSAVSSRSHFDQSLNEIEESLYKLVCRSGLSTTQCEEAIDGFFNALPEAVENLRKDAAYILANDPAAESVEEVIVCYPGFYAICVYRLSHILYRLKVRILPRMMSEIAHSKTGVDIHPGATIGCPFFIDHGTGIVVGETTEIDSSVRLYQSVTLGALSVDKSHTSKRHPTVGKNTVIYANATILGGDTVIGENCVIGGSVWITESIPNGAKVYHNPTIKVKQQ